MPTAAIAVFAKAPVAGRAKTRLIPLLGPQGAAELQRALIFDTTAKVRLLARQAEIWLFAAGGKLPVSPGRSGWKLANQRGRNLGKRLDRAFRQLFREHQCVVIVGTDSPLLTPRLLRLAFSELNTCDAVLGPCPDGGFYLAGLSRDARGLWGSVRLETRHAFSDARKVLLERGYSCSILPTVADIDRPRDLAGIARDIIRRPALRAAAPNLWRFLFGEVPGLPRGKVGKRSALPATALSKSSPRR